MASEMSSSAWVLMEDDCDCGGPPPLFHLPPPPVPPDLPCELMDMSCPALLNVSDAEFKRIGSFPSITVIVCCTLLSAVILLVIAGLVWRKKRKGVTQTKDFDSHPHHHGPTMMNGTGTGVLYEDLAHARPRPPMAPPSIEMLDVNHHASLSGNGMLGNPKLDFSYFLNPPPIYEELPDHSDRNNGPSEDEFAEDELSVIDVPISHTHENDVNNPPSRYHSAITRPNKPRAASLTRKRPLRNSSSSGGFKSQRSLDRRSRNGCSNSAKYPGTNPRAGGGPGIVPRQYIGTDSSPGSMLILSNQNGMTMKIPPHLVAVLTESALCNGGARPYEIIPTGHPGGMVNGSVVNNGAPANGIYPSSRSSGSSYGDGSSSGSARNNPVNSIESSSFDSGIGPHSIASFLNSPAYDQTVLPPAYPLNSYEYAATGGNPPQYNMVAQHPSFRRLRMTAVDRDHPLYSNHLLT